MLLRVQRRMDKEGVCRRETDRNGVARREGPSCSRKERRTRWLCGVSAYFKKVRESSEREPFRHRARLQVTLVGPWQQGNVQYTHEKGRVTRGNCLVTKLRRTNKPSPGRPFSNAGRSPNPRGKEGGETGGKGGTGEKQF